MYYNTSIENLLLDEINRNYSHLSFIINNDTHVIITPEVWRLRNMYSKSFQNLLACIRKLQQLGEKNGQALSTVLQVSFTVSSLEADLSNTDI